MTDEEIINQMTLDSLAEHIMKGTANPQAKQAFYNKYSYALSQGLPVSDTARKAAPLSDTPMNRVSTGMNTGIAVERGGPPSYAVPRGTTQTAPPQGDWKSFFQNISQALGRVTQNPLRENEAQYAMGVWSRGEEANPANVAFRIWEMFRNKPVEQGGELQPGQIADPRSVWTAITGQTVAQPPSTPGTPPAQTPATPPSSQAPPTQPPPAQLPPGPGGPGQIGMAQGQAWYRTRTGLKTLGMMFDELKKMNLFTPETLAAGITDANILAMYSQNTGMTPIPTTQAEVDAAFPQSVAEKQFQFNKEMTLSEIAANPRSMAQNLINAGMTPEQVGSFLNTLPFVQSLIGKGAIYTPERAATPLGALGSADQGRAPEGNWPGGRPPGYPADQVTRGMPAAGAAGGSVMPTAAGRNPNFQFMSGRQLPVRETMGLIEGQSPKVDIISGLFSYSGQTPQSGWADYQKYLPKGEKNPLTQYA